MLDFIKVGRTEKEIQQELDYYMLKNGAEALAQSDTDAAYAWRYDILLCVHDEECRRRKDVVFRKNKCQNGTKQQESYL